MAEGRLLELTRIQIMVIFVFNGGCSQPGGETEAPPSERATVAPSAERADLIHTGTAVLAKSRRAHKK